MRIRSSLFSLIFVSSLVFTPFAALAAAPAVGSPAPEFVFVGQGDVAYRSADLFSPERAETNRGVVIAWFPKAFTSG